MANNVVIPLLGAEDIEVKVKQISEKGALALLYKTARTDMEYLDKIFGIGNWQCDYKEIKGRAAVTERAQKTCTEVVKHTRAHSEKHRSDICVCKRKKIARCLHKKEYLLTEGE